ncbi:MAG TPA: DUF922 domain-containing protein [Devosia sp.]|nr:DUF922 domain-containing protein [Devosia sp.]
MAALRKTVPLILLACLLAPAVHAADPVSIDRSTIYYDIGGNTVPAITSSILNSMPPQTASFVGMTAFTFSWNYRYAPATDAAGRTDCRITDARVAIEIVTYMPRHRSIRQAPDAIRDQWKDYSVALKRHETRHADDFIAIGSQIPAAITAVHTPDCSTIQAAANAVGQAHVARAQAKGDAYDALTDHGMTDGAHWPGL